MSRDIACCINRLCVCTPRRASVCRPEVGGRATHPGVATSATWPRREAAARPFLRALWDRRVVERTVPGPSLAFGGERRGPCQDLIAARDRDPVAHELGRRPL